MPNTTPYDAAPFVPATRSLPKLRAAVGQCRGCPLFAHATHGVFGAGPRTAKLLLVGEQPGDQEDLAGQPFVGPAGRLLDEALEASGLDRSTLFITNAVKHFKWEPRGKRRVHKQPTSREVNACRPWLDAELKVVRPVGIVLLGAVAARAFLGRTFRLLASRGKLQEQDGQWLLPTYHPSALLRAPDRADRRRMSREFQADLRRAAQKLAQTP